METLTKTKWAIDPTHSEIQFKVKHLMITTVTGSFQKFEASAQSSDDDFADLSVTFSADINSITTGNEQRDGHLKSADFFDAQNFPEIKFVSRSVKKAANNLQLTGDLTIRGITKTITLDVEVGGTAKDPWGQTKAGFELNGKISRKEFGLQWNALTEAGGAVVADEVKIHAQVQLVKQQ